MQVFESGNGGVVTGGLLLCSSPAMRIKGTLHPIRPNYYKLDVSQRGSKNILANHDRQKQQT